jgi:hypothetical protein
MDGEVFIMSVKQMKVVETMQLEAACLILGCNRHTSKDAIYGDLKCQPLSVCLDKYRSWLFHELTVADAFLPLHKSVWASNATPVRALPAHSFCCEIHWVVRQYTGLSLSLSFSLILFFAHFLTSSF